MRRLWIGAAALLTLFVAAKIKADGAPSLASIEKAGCAPYRPTEVAIPACTELIARSPNLAAAYAVRGNAYRIRRDYESALADLEKSLEIAPDNGFTRARRALTYFATLDPRAESELEKLLASVPSDARGFEARSQAHLKTDNLDRALADLDLAGALAPDDPLVRSTHTSVLIAKNDWASALTESDKVIARVPDAAIEHFHRGEALSNLGRADEALASFSKAHSLDPNVPTYSIRLRQEQAKLTAVQSKATNGKDNPSRDGKAFDPLASWAPGLGKKVEPADPTAARAYYQKAVPRIMAGDFRAALADLDTALSKNPNFAGALLARAYAHLKLGETSPAIADLDKALAIDARSLQACTMRGEAKAMMGDLDGAFADYERAIAVDSKHADALAGRGWIYFHKRNIEAAKRDFDAALTSNPANASAHLGMAELHLQAGNRLAAIEEYREVLIANPNLPQAREGLEKATSFAPRKDVGTVFGAPMRVVVVKAAWTGCVKDCPEWISAEGFIGPDAVRQLRNVLISIGRRKLPVFVNSHGGWVDAGLELGEIVRKHGLDVVVTRTEFAPCVQSDAACSAGGSRGIPVAADAHCESACAFMLAGGTRRLVGASAVVGVHPPSAYRSRGYSKGTLKLIRLRESPQSSSKRSQRFFTRMGIAPGIMSMIENTSRDGMHWLTRDELRSTAMMTDEMDGERLIAEISHPSWTIAEQHSAAAAARKAFAKTLEQQPQPDGRGKPAMKPAR